MKAIKDSEYVIVIGDNYNPNSRKYWWVAHIQNNTGLDENSFYSSKMWKSEKGARNNWTKFAEVNQIKDWRFEN